jgi:hypothetical protein
MFAFISGYHNRLNAKAGVGLGFYRLVPHLRQEAEIAKLLVEGGDLRRATTSRSGKVNKALATLWKRYEDGEVQTSEFLASVGNIYGVSL